MYRFRDGTGTVLYIGRATSLRSRVASYWSDLRERGHLVAMVARIADVEAVSCDSVHEAAWLERNLLEAFQPSWNRTPGGQESAVCIRLDRRPRSPGLSVQFRVQDATGVSHFGPYLGGLRARQAVSGLHRLFPLALTASGLRGAEMEMARARGVGAADRETLADGLAAVLSRERPAMAQAMAGLHQLRDHAAQELAFELAGRIQHETGALAWVLSPQRVAAFADTNLDVCGWSDGILVTFGIRGGRLREWSQRRCPRPQAVPFLDATPARWKPFAQRNAELAAALTSGGG